MNTVSITKFPPLEYARAEALNTLCTNLSFSGESIKTIMLTSTHASEGKSFLSMNIMRTMAKFGKSVVLVDADLRRSMIRSQYGLRFGDKTHGVGLAHYLAGKVNMEDVVYQTDIEGAYLVPIGREVTNPLPLFNSPRFSRMLDWLAKSADYVIVDAPPVGTVIDAAQIAKYCDGAVIVVGYNTVHRQQLIDVKNQLEQTECPILGTVLNMVEYDNYLSKKYYRSYYSNYGYYNKEYRKKETKDSKPEKEKEPKRKT